MSDNQQLISDLKEQFATKDEFDKYTHNILAKLDKVLAELESIRQEQTLLIPAQSAHTVQLEAHENRLNVIESKIGIPSPVSS